MPSRLAAGDDVAQKPHHVGQLRLLVALAAGEAQIGLDHLQHLGHVGIEAAHLLAVVHQLELEPHARQGRAQVVRDAGEHLGALCDLALDALTHAEEGGRRLAHFGGALRPERRHVDAAPERFRRRRKPAQRAHLVAQEQHGDGERHERRPHHPAQHDEHHRGVEPVARHRDLEHIVAVLDAHEKARGPLAVVYREGAEAARAERCGEIASDLAALVGCRREIGAVRQDAGAQAGHGIDQHEKAPLVVRHEGVAASDDERDLVGRRGGIAAHEGGPEPVVEHPGADDLAKDERRRQQQYRAAEQAVRQDRLDPRRKRARMTREAGARARSGRFGRGAHAARSLVSSIPPPAARAASTANSGMNHR